MDDLELAQKAGVAPWDDYVEEHSDFHVAVFRDRYPVTPGHLLFVPRYNNPNIISEAFELAYQRGSSLVASKECDAFNIGFNCGVEAGQTVMYPHVHLMPRRKGDVEDPVGGVRNTIPGKGNYKK